jgi:hypothetical protein
MDLQVYLTTKYFSILDIFFISDFIFYTTTHRVRAILQSPCPSVHTYVADISASTGRNDFIFDIWLWHGDLYCVSPFQVYRTSTSCLQCDLKFFMFAVMKTFVTVISALEISWICCHIYKITVVIKVETDINTSITASPVTLSNNVCRALQNWCYCFFIFDIWLWHGDLYRVSPFQVYRTSTSCLPCDLQMNEWGYS